MRKVRDNLPEGWLVLNTHYSLVVWVEWLPEDQGRLGLNSQGEINPLKWLMVFLLSILTIKGHLPLRWNKPIFQVITKWLECKIINSGKNALNSWSVWCLWAKCCPPFRIILNTWCLSKYFDGCLEINEKDEQVFRYFWPGYHISDDKFGTLWPNYLTSLKRAVKQSSGSHRVCFPHVLVKCLVALRFLRLPSN